MSTDRSYPERRDLDAQGNVVSSAQKDQRHPWEADLNGDELASMPFLDPGAALHHDESCLDLNQRNGGPFTPTGRRLVRDGDRSVAQRDLDPDLWNRRAGEDAEPSMERPEGA